MTSIFRAAAKRLSIALFTAGAALYGTAGQAQSLDMYLSPPGEQTSTRPGAVIEDFGTGGVAAIGASGSWTIGSFVNPPETAEYTPFDEYGGAGGAGRYLRVVGGPVEVTLTGARRYVGFWWSAGDESNQIEFYDNNDNLLATFTTASLVALLTGPGNITAIDGNEYAKALYYGNPNPPPDRNDGEPYGYVNLILSGTSATFGKIILRGNNFEVDNIAVVNEVETSPTWVHYGSQPVTQPAGAIGAGNDTATTVMNVAVNGTVGGNDTAPVGSTYAKLTDPANGTVVFTGGDAYTYTPASGFVGVDSFTYRVCKPAPDDAECADATVNITVAPDAVDQTVSTTVDTPVSSSVPNASEMPPGVTFSVPSAPSSGSVTMNPATGAYTYTPESGFVGTATFQYQICLPAPNDSVCDTATVTINVTAANVAPVASNVSIGGTPQQGQTLTGSYTYSDANSDVEGTSTFRWVRSSDPGSPLGGTTVGTGGTYVPAIADVGQYLFFCVTPQAQTGVTPGAEVCSPVSSAVLASGTSQPSATPTPVPTLSEWALLLLSGLIAIGAFVTRRRV